MDIWDEVDKAQPQAPASDIWDEVDKIGPRPPSSRPLEFGDPRDVPFGVDFRAGFSDNPADRYKAIAEHFGVDPRSVGELNGKVGFFDPRTRQFHPLEDDWTDKAQQMTAEIAARSPSAVAAGLAEIPAAMTGNPLAMVLAPAVGAAVGEYLRQKIGERMFEDPIGYPEMGIEAAIGGAAGGVAVLNRGYKIRQVAKDISKLDAPSTKNMLALANKWKIDLTPAEASGLPSLVRQQKLLDRLDESSNLMGEFYAKRRGQVGKALTDYLDSLAVEKSAFEGNLQGIRATAQHMDNLRTVRSEAVRPIYKAAYERGATVDVKPIIDEIDARISKVAGSKLSKLKSIRKQFFNETKTDQGIQRILKDGVEELDEVKKAIDDEIGAAQRSGRNNIVRELTQIKHRLTDYMDEVVAEYGHARGVFQKMSGPINEAENSIIGTIAEMKKEQAKRAGRLLFSSIDSDPVTILKARQAVTMGGGPDTWEGLIRAHMTDIMEQKLKDTAQRSPNLGGRIRTALFGSDRQRAIWKAALTDDQYQALDDLMAVLESSSRAGGRGVHHGICPGKHCNL